MHWSDMSSWAQTLIMGSVMIGSVIAYMRMEFRNNRKDREAAAIKHDEELKELRKEIEIDMSEAKLANQAAVENERIERRIDIQRLEKSLENLKDVPQGIALVAQATQNLSDRLLDRVEAQDQAIGDVKHSVRGIHSRLDDIAIDLARSSRSSARASARKKT